MLELLPPELLREVILLSLPLDTHSTYQSRQTLLCAFSLVSHQLCGVAQPLLWRVVRLKVASKAMHQPVLTRHIRTLHANDNHERAQPEDVLPLDTTMTLVRSLPQLEELRLEHFVFPGLEASDIQSLLGLFNLQHLILHYITLPSHPHLDLPNLESLTYIALAFESRGEGGTYNFTDSAPFSPASLPALRAYQDGGWGETVVHFEDLEMLQTRYFVVQEHEGALVRRAFPILVTFSVHDIFSLVQETSPLYRHVQLDVAMNREPVSGYGDADEETLLEALAKLHGIPRCKTPIRTLRLPPHFRPSRLATKSRQAGEDCVEFLAACAGAGVEVIWRDGEEEAGDDIGVSKGFWEFAKQQRRAQEEQVGQRESR